jgi:lysophospholipase L1-like esterase
VSALRRAVAIAAVIVAASITAGAVQPPAAPHTAPTWAPVVEQPEAPTCAGVAIVGDSITSWDPPYRKDPGQTWVTTAIAAGIDHRGGWARPGARLDEMLANVTASPDVCYLIVMGGTNDVVAGIPIESRLVALEAIIAAVDAEHVVLSAVAPLGLDPEAGIAWNEALAAHAAAERYAFIDPWSSFRDGFGWVAGASLPDAVHPTPATAAVVGQRIAAQLERFAIVDQAGPAVLQLAV